MQQPAARRGRRCSAAIALFTEGKQPDFDSRSDAVRTARACAAAPDLLRVFLEIQLRFALAGSDMPARRARVLARVAALLGVVAAQLARIEAVLRCAAAARGPAQLARASAIDDTHAPQAYEVLEVDADVTDDEVTKAYRRLMSRHHPDKLKANGLPDSMLEARQAAHAGDPRGLRAHPRTARRCRSAQMTAHASP